jgi:hypothetical protein
MLPAPIRGAFAAHGGTELPALAVVLGLILAIAVGFMIQVFLS